MNAEVNGIDWFSVCSRGFRGSQVEQWALASDMYFTNCNCRAYVYSLDLINSDIVQKLLAKKANTEVFIFAQCVINCLKNVSYQ